MKKYALVKDNLVINVIVIDPLNQDLINSLSTNEVSVIEDIDGKAAIDGTWNPVDQKFYPVKPYQSWIWNEDLGVWVEPKPRPTEIGIWIWDESVLDFIDSTASQTFGPKIIED